MPKWMGYNCSPTYWQWKEPLLPISRSFHWKNEHSYLTYDITDGRLSRKLGISSAYLWSAQHDKTLEHNILHENTDITMLFITPEWPFSSNKIELVTQLVQSSIDCSWLSSYHIWMADILRTIQKSWNNEARIFKPTIYAVDSYSYTRNNVEATGNVYKSIHFQVYS